MRRAFIPKYASKDATLPGNYRELYFDVIRQKWRTIFAIGIVSLLFFLPAIAFLFAEDFYFMRLSSSTYTTEEIEALRITSHNYLNIGFSLGIVIAAIGVSGLSRITLLLSREEGVFFWHDFGKGVRQNLKANAVFFLIYAILVYLSLLVIENTLAGFWKYLPLGIVQALVFPLLLVNAETTSVYSWKLGDSFRNSALILIKNFVVVFLFATLLSAFPLLLLIPYIYLKYILLAVAIFLVYPFVILGMRVYFNRVLDRDINKEHYPEIYKRGIDESKEEDFLKNVVMRYYGPYSTYGSILEDPYLENYQNYISFPEGEWRKTPIPKEAIRPLNQLRGLAYQGLILIEDGKPVLKGEGQNETLDRLLAEINK